MSIFNIFDTRYYCHDEIIFCYMDGTYEIIEGTYEDFGFYYNAKLQECIMIIPAYEITTDKDCIILNYLEDKSYDDEYVDISR